MKKLRGLVFLSCFIFGVFGSFTASAIDLTLPLSGPLPATDSLGALDITVGLVPGGNTHSGADLQAGILATALQPYTYSSNCSFGGRAARWFPCTRIGTLAKSELYRPFTSGESLKLTVSFYLNPGRALTMTLSTLLAQPSFTHTVKLYKASDLAKPLYTSTGTKAAYSFLPPGHYDVEFSTPSFFAEGFSLILK